MAQVLLVEPDSILAKTYALALHRQGHHVMCAGDAQSAINATDSVRPDCIVLEIQLPEHNGIEFLYELRSHTDWQDIPVIVLSKLDPNRIGLDQNKMLDLGIKVFGYKPDTSLTTLTEMVNEVLKVRNE